jgi:DUF4097 and DUF4098 domain-containing protein YvlB
MKKLLALTLAATVWAALTGCKVHLFTSSGNWSDADLKAVTNFIQNAEIPASLKNLQVDNRNGAIHITGTENGPARWTWKVAVRARTDAIAQQIAAGVRCDTELDGGRLKLAVSVPESREPHSIQSDFEISAPKFAAVRTQTHFGKTDLADLGGDVEAADQNGDMEIHHVGGHVRAQTSFASLAVSDTGPATLKNQNGDIQATRIGGPLEAETSFASLIAQDIRGPASLANQNGDIKATAIGGLLDAKTSFASHVARDIHGPASLTNQNGKIEATAIAGALKAKTSFASLVAHDIGGPVHLRDQNGSVDVVQARGDADIKTSFDRLSVEGIEGDAVLMNQNGGVAASGVTGSVKADTSFAALEIKGAGSEFVCHNQMGAIRLRATSTALTHIEASTSFDTLELHLPAELKPAIQARTTFGDIQSDFPVLMKPGGADAFADVAPGTPRATLRNQNGNIRVLRD